MLISPILWPTSDMAQVPVPVRNGSPLSTVWRATCTVEEVAEAAAAVAVAAGTVVCGPDQADLLLQEALVHGTEEVFPVPSPIGKAY